MAGKIGVISGLYHNTGTYGTPVWAEIKCVGDAAIESAWVEADASSRDSRVMLTDATMKNYSVTGKVKVVPDNTAYEALLAAHTQDKSIEILALNGKTNVEDSTGVRFHAKVLAFGEDQALATVLYRDFTLKPCPFPADEPPKLCRITSGAPVYSEVGVVPS